MPLEIERKFLVENDSWRDLVKGPPAHFTQGYLALGDEHSPEVRIRLSRTLLPRTTLAHEEAFITAKSRGDAVREEVEATISPASARTMLAACVCVLEKTRYRVPEKSGLVFEIDVYHGPLDGLVLAEIELPDESAPFDMEVGFLGTEVTTDLAYKNAIMARTGRPAAPRRKM